MTIKSSRLESVITLEEHKLFHYLVNHCVYIMSRKDESHVYRLHACDDFYVELRLDRHCSSIQHIALFRNLNQLAPYIGILDLGTAFN